MSLIFLSFFTPSFCSWLVSQEEDVRQDSGNEKYSRAGGPEAQEETQHWQTDGQTKGELLDLVIHPGDLPGPADPGSGPE